MAFKYNEAANVSIRSVGGRWNIDEDGEVWCKCDPPEPAIELTVKKEGKNQGKIFYKCDKDDDDEKCGLFVWGDKVEKTRKQFKLGDDYANPLDPAAIRANAAGAAQARANGGSAPQTPSQKKKRPTRNVASDSDGEDTPAYPGWYASDSDGEQRRGPSSSASKRQHLATPDPSPSVKKIKRLDKSNIGYLGPPPELNTFGVAPSASTSTAAVEALNAEDPFPTLLETVEMAQLHSRKIKAQLKSVTVRNGWLEGELTSVRARLGEAEERVGKVEGALQAKMEESELRSAIIESLQVELRRLQGDGESH